MTTPCLATSFPRTSNLAPRPFLMRLLRCASLLALSACASAATSGSTSSRDAAPPALDAITEADLRRDLDVLASDAMRGREAGTLDELRASVWVAERAREAGLEPAGDDGTFFQFWPMRRMRLASQSRVVVGGSTLALWKDVVITTLTEAAGELP